MSFEFHSLTMSAFYFHFTFTLLFIPFLFHFKFIFLFLAALRLDCWAHRFLCAVRGSYPSLWGSGFSLQQLLLWWSPALGCAGFRSCSTEAQDLWQPGLAAPQHVGSSRTKGQTGVPCIARWVLNHWTTREVVFLLN